MRLLLVEDDQNLSDAIAEQLQKDGYITDCCYDDGGCVDKGHAFVIVMIPLQIRSVNHAEDVLLVGKKIFCDLDGGNLLQLLCDAAIIGNGILFLHTL